MTLTLKMPFMIGHGLIVDGDGPRHKMTEYLLGPAKPTRYRSDWHSESGSDKVLREMLPKDEVNDGLKILWQLPNGLYESAAFRLCVARRAR
jgi:hypothetical protein